MALATKDLLKTDIPRPMLEHLVPLALKVKNAKVTSVQFIPPLINTAYPDWAKIRQITARALRVSVRPRAAVAAPWRKRFAPHGGARKANNDAVTGIAKGCGP